LSGQLQGAVDDPPDSVDLERRGLQPLFDRRTRKPFDGGLFAVPMPR